MGQVGKRYSAEERIALIEQGRGLLAGGWSIDRTVKELGISLNSWDNWIRWDEAGRPDRIPREQQQQTPRTVRRATAPRKPPMQRETRSAGDYESIIVDLLFQVRALQEMLGSQGEEP